MALRSFGSAAGLVADLSHLMFFPGADSCVISRFIRSGVRGTAIANDGDYHGPGQ